MIIDHMSPRVALTLLFPKTMTIVGRYCHATSAAAFAVSDDEDDNYGSNNDNNSTNTQKNPNKAP